MGQDANISHSPKSKLKQLNFLVSVAESAAAGPAMDGERPPPSGAARGGVAFPAGGA